MKNKKTIIITIGIITLMIPMVFAIIAGENYTVEFSDTVRNCYIEDSNGTLSNNYSQGLNFTEEGNKVIINTNPKLIPEDYIVSCEVRGEEETQSSSGSGAAPKDWSAKCGYNKECLYGTSNVTSNETTIIPIDTTEDTTESIKEEDKELPKGWKFSTTILVIVGLGFIGFLLYKIFKPKEELPESIGFNDVEDHNTIQKGGQEV